LAPLLVATLCLCSCRAKPARQSAKPAGIHKEFQRGPVTVVMDVNRSEITTAERLNLTVDVTAEEDYEVRLPEPGDKLDQFGIVDCQTSQPELVGGNKTRIRRSYTLEPFLSGEYVIPPLKIGFVKKGESPHEMETGELRIQVNSLLPGKVTELQVKDIAPPVGLPGGKWSWPWAVAVVALVAAAVLAWRRLHRGEKEAQQAAIAPDELALRELDKLVAEDLVARGEIKLFYQRVSDILRRYIENRFGLRAPEQTTEEFLADLRESRRLSEKYHPLLETFLVHCDMVKFAEYQPEAVEVGRTLDSCRTFIVHTAVSTAPTAPG